MAGQLELATGLETAHVAGTAEGLVFGVQLIDADAGVKIAICRLFVLGRPVKKLELAVGVLHGFLGKGFQAGARFQRVVVVHRVAARLNFVLAAPVADDLGTGAVFQVKANLVVARVRLVHATVVYQRHGVFAVFVLHLVIDTLLLHQAADKIEIGLAVLAAVFPLGESSRGFVLEAGQTAMGFEDLLNNLRHGFVLEDAAVRLPRQKPEPGMDGGLVDVGLGLLGAVDGVAYFGDARPTGNVTVEVSRFTCSQLDPRGHVLPQHLVCGDVGALAFEPQRKLAQTRKVLMPRKLDQQKLVGTEWRGNVK